MSRPTSVRVFVKKQRQIGHLTFRQVNMLKIGTVALATVKNRVQAAKNADDGPAKPLAKYYAKWKSKKLRKRAVRDLTFTGDMINTLQVRTVNNNYAQARHSTAKGRAKANRQQQLQPWMLYSPANQRDIHRAAKMIFGEMISRLIQ